MESEKSIRYIVKAQSIARKFVLRSRFLKKLEDRYEKIYDPRRDRYFYYDRQTDTSSWQKPVAFGKDDCEDISSIFTPDEASIIILRSLLRYIAIRKIRMQCQSVLNQLIDEDGSKYYVNTYTNETTRHLPRFMKGRFNYRYKTRKRRGSDATPEDTSSEEESEGSDEELEDEIAKRRMLRKYPRSRAQAIVDAAEDADDKKSVVELNLSSLNAIHITSRIYDLQYLKRLILSHNRLTHINTNVTLFKHLEVLDLRHNCIRQVPPELDELRNLQVLLLGHNRISTYSGNIYRLQNLQQLDLSHNPFNEIPVEVGNLELLKELHEWEVGVGCLKQLVELDVRQCGLMEWPPQLEKIPVLAIVNVSHNSIPAVLPTIGETTTLKYLDISHNHVTELPAEIYHCTLMQTLIGHHNMISAWPSQTGITNRFTYMVKLDMSYNKFTAIDGSFQVFYKLQTLDLSHNEIAEVTNAISVLINLNVVNLSHNKIKSLPEGFGQLTAVHTCHLNNNQLSEMPVPLTKLFQIKYLNLSNNYIGDIKSSYFSTLLKLTELYIDHNVIPVIPFSVFSLTKLVIFSATFNRLSMMPDPIGQLIALKELYLSNNEIASIPMSVAKLKSLDIFEIEHNCISHLPSSITALSTLRRLNLKHNALTDFPPILRDVPKLVSWDLSGNAMLSFYKDLVCASKTEEELMIAAEQDETQELFKMNYLNRRCAVVWNMLYRALASHVGNMKPRRYTDFDDWCTSLETALHTASTGHKPFHSVLKRLPTLSTCLPHCKDMYENPTLLRSIEFGWEYFDCVVAFENISRDLHRAAVDPVIQGEHISAYDILMEEAHGEDEVSEHIKNIATEVEISKESSSESSDRDSVVSLASRSVSSVRSAMSRLTKRSATESEAGKVNFKNVESPHEGLPPVASQDCSDDEADPGPAKLIGMPEIKSEVASTNGDAELYQLAMGQTTPAKSAVSTPLKAAAETPWSLWTGLLYAPQTGDVSEAVFSAAMDTYAGLTVSLLKVAEELARTIRRIEITYHLESKMDVAQRRYDDMADLLRGQEQLFAQRGALSASMSMSVRDGNVNSDISPNNNRDDRPNSVKMERQESFLPDDLPEVSTLYPPLTDFPLIMDNAFAKRVVAKLYHQRWIVLQLSGVTASSAVEALSIIGWDPVSATFRGFEALYVDNLMIKMRSKAMMLWYYFGRCMQCLQCYDDAVEHFDKALKLIPNTRPVIIEKTRSLLAKGDFKAAKNQLMAWITPMMRRVKPREKDIKVSDVMKVDRECGMLMIYTDNCMTSLMNTAFDSKDQLRTFNPHDDGLLLPREQSFPETDMGRTPYSTKVAKARKEKETAWEEAKAAEADRAQYRDKKSDVIKKAKAILDAHKEFMEKIGPIALR